MVKILPVHSPAHLHSFRLQPDRHRGGFLRKSGNLTMSESLKKQKISSALSVAATFKANLKKLTVHQVRQYPYSNRYIATVKARTVHGHT